ncbi:uncharacterized protein LOC124265603 [Haliotis rubra]|uniref:uncharacterized protein LOC124265603 n=1 Tax=Haliotis rubra TaxID=36100 RepID=UPI001EE51CCA|nr:uncharacterized protein LOC124265603 [Haliotis rubra]
METIIVTLTLLLFVAGIQADCTVSSAISISGAGQGSCSVEPQTVADNTEVKSCGITCTCRGPTLTCCFESSCTTVAASCSSIQVTNGAPSCELKRKRRDLLEQLLHRAKREEETTTTEDRIVIDGTTSPPTTTTTAASPPVRK